MRLIFPLLLLPFPAFAETFPLDARVTSALITGEGGVVTYTASLNAGAGRHTLTLRLPALDDTLPVADIRLPDGLRMVGSTTTVGQALPIDRELSDEQQAARDARIAAERAVDAHKQTAETLRAALAAARARQTLAESTAKTGLGGGDVVPTAQDLTALAAAIAEITRAAAAEIADIEFDIAALAPEMTRLQQALELAKRTETALIAREVQRSGTLTVEVAADAPVSGTVEVDTIEGVSWSPTYRFDLTQTGAAGKLAIRRQAEVTRYVGRYDAAEPLYSWGDLNIVLSTADLSETMTTWLPGPDIRRLVDKAQKARASADYDSARGAAEESLAMPEPVVLEIAPDRPTMDFRGQTIVFDLGAGQRIDSRADRTVFDIDTVALDVDLYALANNALSGHAFLYTDLTNDSAGVLLAGSGPLTRDGTVIGSIGLPTLLPGQEEPLGLGPLYGLRLERDTLSVQEGDSGLITTRSEEEYRYRTTITSSLAYDMPLRLVDVIPTSESEDLRIEMSASPRPDTDTRDGQRGVLEWRIDMPAGAEKTVDFGYRMQWPAEKVPVNR